MSISFLATVEAQKVRRLSETMSVSCMNDASSAGLMSPLTAPQITEVSRYTQGTEPEFVIPTNLPFQLAVKRFYALAESRISRRKHATRCAPPPVRFRGTDLRNWDICGTKNPECRVTLGGSVAAYALPASLGVSEVAGLLPEEFGAGNVLGNSFTDAVHPAEIVAGPRHTTITGFLVE